MDAINNIAQSVTTDMNITLFLQSMTTAAVIGYLMALMVHRCSRIMGDRVQYFFILPVLVPTVVLIISVIKSSLALSLGLVGALSIVRFRAPIKEPEELCYLFLAIAVGIGLGAGQIAITLIAFVIVSIIILINSRINRTKLARGVILDIDVPAQKVKGDLSQTLNKLFDDGKIPYDLRRSESQSSFQSVTYYIEPTKGKSTEQILIDVKNAVGDANITLVKRTHSLG